MALTKVTTEVIDDSIRISSGSLNVISGSSISTGSFGRLQTHQANALLGSSILTLGGNLTTAGTLTTQNNNVTINAAGAARTLTLTENLSVSDGQNVVLAAAGQENTFTMNESFTIGDGNSGTITFSASSKTLTISDSGTFAGGGNTLTLAGNLTTQNNNVTINAVGAARTLTLNESLTVGDGNDGTITFSGASKTLTVEDTSLVNQDLTSDASPTFAGGTITGNLSVGGTLTAQEVHTEFESASIIFTSGSTIFGNSTDDTHLFSGSLAIHNGEVGVAAGSSADELVIKNNGDAGISILSPNGNSSRIQFGSVSDNDIGHIGGFFNSGNEYLFFSVDGSTRMVIGGATSAGNVGIGTDNPTVALEVFGSADQQIRIDSTGNRAQLQFDGKKTSDAEFAEINFANDGDSAAAIHAMRDGANDAARLAFFTQPTGGSVTERVSIDSGGKVGIGVSSPTGKLSIAGTSGVQSNIYVDNHAGDQDSANFIFRKSRNTTIGSHTVVQDDDDLGSILFQGSDGNSYETGAQIVAEVDGTPGDGDMPGRLLFKTTADGSSSSTERMRITSAGNVGIGTDNPGVYQLNVQNPDGNNGGWAAFIANLDSTNGQSNGMEINAGSNSSDTALKIASHDGGTEFFRIKGDGNVGIGTNAPRDELDVVGNININGNGTRQIKFDDGAVSEGAIVFDEITNGFIFKVGGTSGAGKTDALHIENTGNVGIGTNNPLAPLHIHNNACILRLSDANSDSLATATPHIAFYDRADSNELGLIGYLSTGDGILSFNNKNNASIDFRTNNTLAVTIDNAQKVGIGTTAPSYKLDVESSVNDWLVSIVNTATSGNAFCQQLQFTGVSPNNVTSKFQQFVDGGSTVRFEVRSNGGVASFQSNDADLSDESVKKDITDASNCLDTINNIKVRNFKYKDQTDDRTLIGVIAQEVEAVDSSLVDDSEELKRVYNKDIMFMMLKSIQELTKRIEELEKK